MTKAQHIWLDRILFVFLILAVISSINGAIVWSIVFGIMSILFSIVSILTLDTEWELSLGDLFGWKK